MESHLRKLCGDHAIPSSAQSPYYWNVRRSEIYRLPVDVLVAEITAKLAHRMSPWHGAEVPCPKGQGVFIADSLLSLQSMCHTQVVVPKKKKKGSLSLAASRVAMEYTAMGCRALDRRLPTVSRVRCALHRLLRTKTKKKKTEIL